jgi:hypothetical protein
MKRCFNCGNLVAQEDRDVCLKCLNRTLKEDKTARVGDLLAMTPTYMGKLLDLTK